MVFESHVSAEVLDGVAHVKLSRPQRHNALDEAMFRGLVEAADGLAVKGAVRAVVLSGQGPSFCSGLDIASLAESGPAEIDALLEPGEGQTANLVQRAAYCWTLLPTPVIAAIHGACLGGGLQIALAADMRVAAPEARLAISEPGLGLIPDMGISHSLPRLVPIDVAKELTFTSRVISGEEAWKLGLVTRLAPDPLTEATALASEIAERRPEAIRASKQLYERTWDAPPEEGLRLETELQRSLLESAEPPALS